jgi:hypothetical protein
MIVRDDTAPDFLPRAYTIASAAALGHALQLSNGFYDDRALVWLTAAFGLALAGMLTLHSPLRPEHGELGLRLAAALAVGWQVSALATAVPGIHLQPRTNLQPFQAGALAELVLVLVGVIGIRRLARLWFPALIALHLALGVWMLRASPSPHIDVVTVHREAFDALARGQSPYQISFDNIYGPADRYYNPDAVKDGRVMFGYPYPPLTLLLAGPAHVIAGDYRYAHLFAWVAAAALVGHLGAPLFSKLAAALLLTQPRGFFVLEQGWTEPIVLLLFTLTVFTMTKRPQIAAWAGGLVVVSKQYLTLGVPLLWRFFGRNPDCWRRLLQAAAIAVVVTLPFALWHPASFLESVVLLQTREPFRIDSLSYLSWAARRGLGAGSFLWALGAAFVTLAAGMLATPNSPAGFAMCLAFSTFAMFAFGSKAFCNYYFFVAGALCCAAAAASARSSDR